MMFQIVIMLGMVVEAVAVMADNGSSSKVRVMREL